MTRLSRVMTLAGLCMTVAIGSAHAEPHELDAGQQLTFVLSESRPGGEAVQQQYFSKAFPLAQANGMRELTTFRVQRTLAGERQPQGSGLYLWPSREAAQRTRTDVAYTKDLRPMRTQAWNELQSVDVQVTAPLTIELDRQRVYTAALVWTGNTAAFERDLQAAKTFGAARVVLSLPASRYENLKDGETTPPDRLLLLEWASEEALAKFGEDPAMRMAHAPDKVSRAEWYQLGFWD